MKKVISYRVTEQEAGQRLEQILKRQLEMSPQEISQAKFRREGICVGGSKCKVTMPVHAGDLVEVCLEEEDKASNQLVPHPGELTILYEDEDVLAVYKPAGIVCHPSGGHYEDTLANIMQYYFRKKGQQVVIRLIGRLDQETSGVVLAAKSQAAASRLNRQKELGILKKEYLALVQDCPGDLIGTVREPIGPVRQAFDQRSGSAVISEVLSRDAIKMQVTPYGKDACTHYEVLETRAGSSLVQLYLETGRTHQIRVHMEYLGCPLLGDTLYNPKRADHFSRAALHAVRLEFCQPFTKEHICLEARLPADFITHLREGGFTYVTGCGGTCAGDRIDRLRV